LILKLSITLAGDRNCVDPVVQGIMQLVRQMHCAAGKEEAVQLALNEALANAVVHGAKADPSKLVECEVACDESRGVLIVVRDPGKGFPVPSGDAPEVLRFDPAENLLLVVSAGSGDLAVIRVRTNFLLTLIPVGDRPQDLAVKLY